MDYLGMECHLEYKDGPPVTEYESHYDFIIQKLKSQPMDASNGNSQAGADGASVLTEEEAEAMKWKTTGFKQVNTMGGVMWAVSSKDGKKLAEYKLDTPPAWDSLAAADGKLFLCLKDGSVVCYEGK